MMYKTPFQLFLLILILGIVNPLFSQNLNDKTWVLIPDKSDHIELFNTLEISFQKNDKETLVIQKFGKGRALSDTVTLKSGKKTKAVINKRAFATNVFMGVSFDVGSKRIIQAEHIKEQQIEYSEEIPILVSQGRKTLLQKHSFELINENLLKYTIERTTAKVKRTHEFLLKPDDYGNPWIFEFDDDWRLDSDLSNKAMMISLQGIANLNGPLLYFVYPEMWDFRFTPEVRDFLVNERNYSFRKIRNYDDAIRQLGQKAEGYVVWDKNVRTSLIVAYTYSGLNQALVVSEDQIPLMEKYGLKKMEDFRGKFTGMNDFEIYSWAYREYWNECNKKYIVWLGGEHGNIMKPGVADWGVYNKCFFSDLSTKVEDRQEYHLADQILSEMEPMSLVFGWHSYKKDKERHHVSLCSSHGHRVEGLHTLPNMSFSSQIPLSKGFEFKNNHSVQEGVEYVADNKVYISCIQTDCLGLGAWTRPGRGEIPYAWEVTMNWVWLAPAMMEFFYSQATPNDYFIGSLSGPGYMYPKAIPSEKLPGLIREAERLMKELDLKVFEIMDYSEGATVEGNTELTREVIDAYYKYMPDALGFVNGYAPAFSFTTKNKRPLISFDYYLSPDQPKDQAVGDLKELAAFNDNRPYFLLMHVRQWSDITRVKGILDELGPEFELIPLDVFIKMAGNTPSYKERLLEKQ